MANGDGRGQPWCAHAAMTRGQLLRPRRRSIGWRPGCPRAQIQSVGCWWTELTAHFAPVFSPSSRCVRRRPTLRAWSEWSGRVAEWF